MKTLLQIEMYYVREYIPNCRFLKIINETHQGRVDYFLRIYKLECILLHNIFLSATVFSFYMFTFLMFRKLNNPQITHFFRHPCFRFSFIFRYYKVFQVSQVCTCGLSDLLSCGRFVGCFCIARILVSSEHKLCQNSSTCIVSCISIGQLLF